MSNIDPGLMNKAKYSHTKDAKIVTMMINQRFVNL